MTAPTGTNGDTATENPKTVSRKEPERTATTGKDGDDRPERSRRGKGGRRSRPIPRSKPLRRCSSTTGERRKIDLIGPSLERGLSGPIKRLSGTGSVSTDQSRHIRSPIPRADTPRTAVAAFWGRERIG
jgi:hypothetical protein